MKLSEEIETLEKAACHAEDDASENRSRSDVSDLDELAVSLRKMIAKATSMDPSILPGDPYIPAPPTRLISDELRRIKLRLVIVADTLHGQNTFAWGAVLNAITKLTTGAVFLQGEYLPERRQAFGQRAVIATKIGAIVHGARQRTEDEG